MLAMSAANTTPLDFLLAVMRSNSPLIDMKMRIDAARSALPYLHVRAGETKAGDDAKLVHEKTIYAVEETPEMKAKRESFGL
jgi:hypothetical protein